MYRMECPSCGHRLKYTDEHAGKNVRCKKCGEVFHLHRHHSPQPSARGFEPAKTAPLPTTATTTAPKATRAAGTVSVVTGRSGAAYAESRTQLSEMTGPFSDSTFSCQYVLSPDGRRVFHSGGSRGLFNSVVAAYQKLSDYRLDGRDFQPDGFAVSWLR